MKYRIVYIDESDAWLNTFYQTFKADFEIIRIKVKEDSTINSIIEEIFKNEPDGVVTDYLLDEEGQVDFNGNQIVDAIRKVKPHFPITMLTSYEPQAINHMEDVHIINGKSDLDGESEEALQILKSKIQHDIESFYRKLSTTQSKIEELVKKKNESELEPQEEENLTKLFILMDELEPEGKEIRANLIKSESITKLNDFVIETKEILEELRKRSKK
ncbi:hypothetical protein QLS71_016255 [Mariniflexile litorale]|uniref:Response regulator receiver domain-containing protein n=1 Tax=Mariniflexile litorale TaxID=3045158 RepID=A0AAU7EEJ0_9FLAO|nr:hypothetical protein [Mariniflexile sp. KMM 9835]MDQ8212302.1 hypothetical protein [Mariniflexile sp. KMM 9835]